MLDVLQRQHRFRASRIHLPRAAGLSLLLALLVSGTALGQQIRVTGFVSTVDGVPIEGAIVAVQQTQIRTTTDIAGRYAITAPSGGVYRFLPRPQAFVTLEAKIIGFGLPLESSLRHAPN